MSSDYQLVLEAAESYVENTLGLQVLDGPERDVGGIRAPDTWYVDPRGTMFHGNHWLASWLCPDSRFYADRSLAERIDLLLDFMLRRQHPDGSIDFSVWRHAPCEVGFTVPGACTAYRKLSAADLPLKADIAAKLGKYIKRAAHALRSGQVYTANHRWAAAVAPLACADTLFPDPENRIAIEDYLDDGIDCTEEGIYYNERSPVYSAVSNIGLILAAESLGRPELLDSVRRNLDFCLHMINPDGFAETGLSFRQDRGCQGVPFGSYFCFKKMAVKDANPRWARAADILLEQGDRVGDFYPVLYLFDDPEVRSESLRREALSETYEKFFTSTRLLRYRAGDFAVTLKADGRPDNPDGWSGPEGEANFLAVYFRKLAVAAVMFKFAYQGHQSFKPPVLRMGEASYWLEQHWRGFELRMPHRRAGRRRVWVPADLKASAAVLIEGKKLILRLEATGLAHVPVAVEFLISPHTQVRINRSEVRPGPGERIWFAEPDAALLDGDSKLTIHCAPSEHRLPIADNRVITGEVESRSARLCFGAYTPFAQDIVIQADLGKHR